MAGALDDPRYQENPVKLFFEDYVLDTIGEMTPERSREIQELNLRRIFKTRSAAWREVLEETLHLSETLPLAILDLWFRNRAAARKQGAAYDPRAFAMDLVDHYLAEDSKVDVWPPGALEEARRRIAETEEGARLLARLPPRRSGGFWARLFGRS